MHKNQFCYKNIHRIDEFNLYNVGHYALAIRTRAAFSKHKEYNLIKSTSQPIPIFTIKHCHERLKDPIIEYTESRKQEAHQRSKLELKFIKKRKSKKNQNEDLTIDYATHEYIRDKLTRRPITYNIEKHCYELNHNRGTLDLIEGHKNVSIAYVWNGSEIQFSHFQKNELIKMNSNVNSTTSMPNELIIDPNNSDFIVVRYKDYIDIAKAPNYNELTKNLTVKPCDKYDGNGKEFVACSLHNKYLTTVDTKHRLQRYDLEKLQYNFSIKLENYFTGDISPISLHDKNTYPSGNNLITITTRHNFGVIDCRAKKNFEMNKILTNQDHMLMKCEKIMNHSISELDENLVYIASSHLLYAFDYRKLKEPVIQWPHHLVKPALLMKTDLYGTHEVICLSSHKSGDFALFNYGDDQLNYRPFNPITLRSSYNNLREKGLFLLAENIKERVNASTTGLALQIDIINSKINVFTQNHYGDIFEHQFNCQDGENEDVNDDKLIERYQEWETFLKFPHNSDKQMSTMERIINSEMTVTDIARLDGVSKILLGEKKPTETESAMETEDQFIFSPSWKFSVNDARQCKDLLAFEIMQIWDNIETEEVTETIIPESKNDHVCEKEKAMDKVSLWLENAVSVQSSSMLNDSMELEYETSQIEKPSTSLNPTFNVSSRNFTSTPAKKKPRYTGF